MDDETISEELAAFAWPTCLFVLDGETSGFSSKRCQLLELTVSHPATGMQRTWWVEEEGNARFEAGALRVNGLTRAALRDDRRRESLSCVLIELEAWVRSLFPAGTVLWVGRNPQFDLRFLRKGGKRVLQGADAAFFEQLLGHRMLDTHSVVFALAIAHGWPVSVDKIDDLYAKIGLGSEAKPHTSSGGAEHCLMGLELAVRAIREGGVRA